MMCKSGMLRQFQKQASIVAKISNCIEVGGDSWSDSEEKCGSVTKR